MSWRNPGDKMTMATSTRHNFPNFPAVQVTINAVENSASVASLVLTTECLIAEIPVEVSEAQQQANYDAMGGGDYM